MIGESWISILARMVRLIRAIRPHSWCPMTQVRNWSQLNETERQQVCLMLASLQEFVFAYDTADRLSAQVDQGSAALRFYMNSLYQYCCNYHLVGGANKLKNILTQLGSGDLLESLEALLNVRLGQTTLAEILRTFRDKFLTHQTFTFKPIQVNIYRKFDLRDPNNAKLFPMMVNDVFFLTRQLYFALAARFPEAITPERDSI